MPGFLTVLASRSPHETSNPDVGCVRYARTRFLFKRPQSQRRVDMCCPRTPFGLPEKVQQAVACIHIGCISQGMHAASCSNDLSSRLKIFSDDLSFSVRWTFMPTRFQAAFECATRGQRVPTLPCCIKKQLENYNHSNEFAFSFNLSNKISALTLMEFLYSFGIFFQLY